MSDITNEVTSSPKPPEKKKRGRKPKPKPENPEPHVPKKRGRKPKGGKIIVNPLDKSKESEYITENVILHLKCNSEDINSTIQNDIGTIEENTLSFQILNDIENIPTNENCDDINPNNSLKDSNDDQDNNINESDTKKLSEKIIDLQKNFYFNDVHNNNSACFWCTCDFDHTPIHIPKYKLNEQYYVYGCFCSPECAVAHLMNESIDTSQKYERYQILNYLYNNIYNNTASIKPAPDPRYLLDKFMGNLTITEYRKLLRQDRLFMVVDKPITRILPEIYEETDLKGSQFENQQNKTSFQIKKSTSKLGIKKSFFS